MTFNNMATSIEKEQENYELKLLSNKDELTNLYSHSYFHEYIREKNLNADKISIIFFDIDMFKKINNTLGHKVGDIILKTIGGLIREKLLSGMQAFRYDGDEFTIVLEGFNSNYILSFAENIRLEIENSLLLLKISNGIPITVSAGIVNNKTNTNEIEEIIKLAETAMSYSKQNGKNQCTIYTPNLSMILNQDSDQIIKKNAMFQSVKSLVCALEAKDQYTGEHSIMVKNYSLMIANNMQLSQGDKEMLEIASILHDCGKIGIPDIILNKVGRLTEKEYNVIKEHSEIGENIVGNFIENNIIKGCIRNHHERWDGRGYPDGLLGNKIPLFARIVAVADSYDAMISNRPYRDSLSKEVAIKELENCKGSQFDPKIVDIFINELKKVSYFEEEDKACSQLIPETIKIESKINREVLEKAYEDKKNYILMFDTNYKIIYTNSKLNKLISKSEEEVKGKKCYKVILGTNSPCKNCKIKNVIKEKKIHSFLKHEITIDGKEHWINQIWIPMFDKYENVENIVEIAIPLDN